MLEYQARQTIAAARAASHFPDLTQLPEIAAHGFRYLKERMWDHRYGGWYRMLDRGGEPLEQMNKHGHGSAYAISACAACYDITRHPDCLDLAKSAFTWLEEHARDAGDDALGATLAKKAEEMQQLADTVRVAATRHETVSTESAEAQAKKKRRSRTR